MKLAAKAKLTAFTAVVAFSAGLSHADELAVSDKPLFTVSSVDPNLVVILDDSGSMGWDVSIDGTAQGMIYWRNADDTFVRDDGTLWNNQVSFAMLWPVTEQTNQRRVPPLIQYAFARSPDYNSSYYDPDVEYTPWPDVGGYTFEDVPVTAAPYHIVDDGPGGERGSRTMDFTDDTLRAPNGDYEFTFYNGMVVAQGTVWEGNPGGAPADVVYNGGNGGLRWVEWNPRIYYTVTESGSYSVNGGPPTTSCAAPHSPADYRAFERNPGTFVGSGSIVALGPDGRCLERRDPQAEGDLQNFANYFTYYRKRHMATRNGLVSALKDIRIGMRAGYFTINDRDTVVMREFDDDPAVDERDVLLEDLLEENFNGNTPNRLALQHAGEQFENNSSIVQYACQKNFTMLFTDGYTNSGGPAVGNLDATVRSFPEFPGLSLSGVPPYSDTHSNTIADIAMRYFRDFDAGGFESGRMPTPPACTFTTGVASLDCNKDVHMNTYVVTLNAQGTVFNNTFNGVDYQTVADAYANPPDWPEPFDNQPTTIDHLYHAAINGRGLMLNARSPEALRESFQQALLDIVAKSRAATALTAASTRISTESKLYQASFNSNGWTGELAAIELETGQAQFASEWMADNVGSRNLITWNGAAQVPLTWDNLTTEQQAAFQAAADFGIGQANLEAAWGTDDWSVIGPRLLDYVAGVDTDEIRNGGALRDRLDERLDPVTGATESVFNPMGAVVNSVPQVMGPRNEGWIRLPSGSGGGDAYQDYIDNFKPQSRNPEVTVFVGANDGALHAFDAETMQELFAYFPGMTIGETALLADPEYDHRFYVDGTPTLGDVYGNGWKTVLVGSLGAGGRGYYALDVTNPTSPKVLWEFSAADDPDLGTAIGQPVITRASDGSWLAVFGNGFGSEDNDGYLFALDVFAGTVKAKVRTSSGGSRSVPGGLGSPRVLMNKIDGLSAEAVFVGDLQGRMFKIDASGDPGSWTVAFGGDPMFIARDPGGAVQPITAAPTVVRTPKGEVGVYFGTGKFFEVDDNVVEPDDYVETFYVVFDGTGNPDAEYPKPGNLTRSDLVDIDLNATQLDQGRRVRTIDESTADFTTFAGWHIDLFVPGEGKGERVVATPSVRFGVLLFTSYQPSQDICSPGGVPRLYVLDARRGAPRLLQLSEPDPDPNAPSDPPLPNTAGIELGAGAPVVPPIVIDTTYDPDGGDYNPAFAALCPFGRPVVAIDPITQERIPVGCLQEGRVNWGQRIN